MAMGPSRLQRLAVGDWRLAAVGSWRLVAVGGWRLVVPGGCPEGMSLRKEKKSGFRKPALRGGQRIGEGDPGLCRGRGTRGDCWAVKEAVLVVTNAVGRGLEGV